MNNIFNLKNTAIFLSIILGLLSVSIITNSVIAELSQTPQFLEFSMEGTIIYVGIDGDLYIYDGESNETIQLTTDAITYQYANPQFAPNGDMVAFIKSDPDQGDQKFDLYIMNLKNRNQDRIAENVDKWGGYDWAPDSQAIAYGSSINVACNSFDQQSASGIRLVNVNNANEGYELAPPVDNIAPLKQPKFSFDGQWISYEAYPCGSEGFRFYTRQLKTGVGFDFGNTRGNWTTSSNYIIWNDIDGNIFLVSPDGVEKQLIYEAGDYSNSEPKWSPSGNEIAVRQYPHISDFYLTEEEVENWQEYLTLISLDDMVHEVICSSTNIGTCQFNAWSPTGSQIIFTEDEDSISRLKLYTQSSKTTKNLFDLSDGGMDWISSDKISGDIFEKIKEFNKSDVLEDEEVIAVRQIPTIPIALFIGAIFLIISAILIWFLLQLKK